MERIDSFDEIEVDFDSAEWRQMEEWYYGNDEEKDFGEAQ